MTSRRLSTRVHETVKSVSSALHNVQRLESEGHSDVVSSSVIEIRKGVKGAGRYPVRDRLCSFSGQVSKVVERAGAAVRVKRSLLKVHGELFNRKCLSSVVDRVSARM